MARPTLRDVHPTNQALARISIAYKNQDYIADQVFPTVTVQKKSDYYFRYGKDFWFRDRAKPRAPGARADRADYAIDTASYVCLNYSLAHGIPDEVRDNADAPLQPDVEAAEFISDGLDLSREIRVATIICSSTGWSTANTPSIQWSADNSDPWNDIMTAIDGVVGNTGRMPNVGVMAWPTWRYLANHPDFLDRIKYTRSSGKLELSDLQAWFNLEKLLVGLARKEVSQEGVTSSMQWVWDDDFWVGYVPPAPALRTPAAGYVLRWGARETNRFREDQEHQDVYEIGEFTVEVVTASDAGAIVYNAV